MKHRKTAAHPVARFLVLWHRNGEISTRAPKGYETEAIAHRHAMEVVLENGVDGLLESEQAAIRSLHDGGQHREALDHWRDALLHAGLATDRWISATPIRPRS